ncbi:MAG TPA: hypothetical protein VFE30_07830 [Anaeromyxobacteraceae bacterium]|jgi:hypothetical protein|nr:hypothetical protein [Anaeromyxobacteraceae bacterium]
MSLQELQEKLLAWGTAEPRKDWLLAARAQHFGRYGEPHEEDMSFESRMNGMLDAYLYDFHPEGGEERTIERFLASQGALLSPEELSAYRDLARNVHAVFEVRHIKPGEIRLRELFGGGDYDVAERRQLVGLAKGDLIEARLLPFEGKLVFSGSFIYHPQAARKRVLAEVKRLKKGAAKDGHAIDVPAFLARLSRMAFKLERYRNVKLESIYDFEAPTR